MRVHVLEECIKQRAGRRGNTSSHRRQDNIKLDLTDTGYEIVGWSRLSQGKPRGCSCKHGNLLSALMKGGAFLNQLSDYQLFKNVHVARYEKKIGLTLWEDRQRYGESFHPGHIVREWEKLRDKELGSLHTSPNIATVKR